MHVGSTSEVEEVQLPVQTATRYLQQIWRPTDIDSCCAFAASVDTKLAQVHDAELHSINDLFF